MQIMRSQSVYICFSLYVIFTRTALFETTFLRKKERGPLPAPAPDLFRGQRLPPYFLGFLMFACAAASRAIGTRNGEQLT